MSAEDHQHDVAVIVRLSPQMREALKVRAAAEDRSVASLLRLAARRYLQDADTAATQP